MRQLLAIIFTFLVSCSSALAQELEARVTVNHKQVSGTNTSVFEDLEKNLTAFINERQWTNFQFQRNERIACTFNITVKKYDESEHSFTCSLQVQAQRPVYNASYTTITFANNDGNFNFEYQEFDQLDFRADVIDNDLTALVAYYVYMIIGIDMDTMSPKGGEECLQTAKNICNNASMLKYSAKGWKAFDDAKNRYALVNDYLDGSMEPFRMMQYKYYREGLDVMVENVERGRAAITESFDLLKQAHENRTNSRLPQLFVEFKRDEIVYIYKGKASSNETQPVHELLMTLNASQSSYWNQIK